MKNQIDDIYSKVALKDAIDSLKLKCAPATVKRRLKERPKAEPLSTPKNSGDERKKASCETTMNMRLAMIHMVTTGTSIKVIHYS